MRYLLVGVLLLTLALPPGFAQERNNEQVGVVGNNHQRILGEYGVFWGGDLRCDEGRCRLVAVAHERGSAVVLESEGRTWRKLGELRTAYHPDSAVWLDSARFAVAVETGSQLVIGEVAGDGVKELAKLVAGFPPRGVAAAKTTPESGEADLFATPYRGEEVAYLAAAGRGQWREAVRWKGCKTPWHPAVRNFADGPVVALGCLDDHQVVVWQRNAGGEWRQESVAQLPHVPRQVAFSRDGERLYVALELGGKGAVIDWRSPERAIRWLPLPGWGATAVRELSDGTVAWGEDQRVLLQRCDQALQCETRALPTGGLVEMIFSSDIDRDGFEDVVILNSAGNGVDVWYGPLWEQGQAIPEAKSGS